jgi:hypothetical protein
VGSYRDEYKRPGPLPLESILFMGCQPGWSPEDEGLHLPDHHHDTERCRRCGGIRAVNAGVEVHHGPRSIRLPERLLVRPCYLSHPRHFVLPTGEVVCLAGETDDPVAGTETVVIACGSCLRSSHEAQVQRLPHRLFAPDKAHLDEDGKTAAAVESSLPTARQGHYAESAQFKGMDINTAI